MPNFRPCGAEIPIFWLSCGANWLLTHELVKNVNLNYYVSVCSRVENAVMRKTWITTITNRTCGYVETRGSWEIVVFYEYHIVLVVMGKTRKYARTMTFYEYQIVNVAVGKREKLCKSDAYYKYQIALVAVWKSHNCTELMRITDTKSCLWPRGYHTLLKNSCIILRISNCACSREEMTKNVLNWLMFVTKMKSRLYQ